MIQGFYHGNFNADCNISASALGVTPGAISQQLRLLEEHVGVVLLVKDGRRATLTPAARAYHGLISQGFGRLTLAQDYILTHRQSEELTLSGFPTLLHRFLNPRLADFRASSGDLAIRMVATHQEPDPQMLEQTFRLTYGEASRGHLLRCLSPITASRSNWLVGTGCGSAGAMILKPWRV